MSFHPLANLAIDLIRERIEEYKYAETHGDTALERHNARMFREAMEFSLELHYDYVVSHEDLTN
jgi:hypothetical protein